MDINNRISAILKHNYGIEATSIEQRPGGWSALAFFVEDKRQSIFLKCTTKKSHPSLLGSLPSTDIPL
ncbi:hypothetical protein E2R56_26535 [Rhodococcus qingshengii]|nr:hypothetical protein E2R56_26535 [Rhodococcus qingshengii]